MARQVVGLQAVTVLIAACLTYGLYGDPLYAMAVFGGGSVSVINGTLLAWRMSRATLHSAHDVHRARSVHHQLRLMYFYAAERFLAVIVLLGLCMAVLQLSPLAVMGGFVMGQATLLAARLFLSGSNKH